MGPYDYTNGTALITTADRRPVAAERQLAVRRVLFRPLRQRQPGSERRGSTAPSTCPSSANLVRARLPHGNFNENVYQVKADVFLSPDLGWMNYVQYDDISGQLGWSSRLRWRVSGGNEVYLVYNKSWDRLWDPTSRF